MNYKIILLFIIILLIFAYIVIIYFRRCNKLKEQFEISQPPIIKFLNYNTTEVDIINDLGDIENLPSEKNIIGNEESKALILRYLDNYSNNINQTIYNIKFNTNILCDILIVGGGGGGGIDGGGGGAGDIKYIRDRVIPKGEYVFKVGKGGNGGRKIQDNSGAISTYTEEAHNSGKFGENSSIELSSNELNNIYAAGGGGGGSYNTPPSNTPTLGQKFNNNYSSGGGGGCVNDLGLNTECGGIGNGISGDGGTGGILELLKQRGKILGGGGGGSEKNGTNGKEIDGVANIGNGGEGINLNLNIEDYNENMEYGYGGGGGCHVILENGKIGGIGSSSGNGRGGHLVDITSNAGFDSPNVYASNGINGGGGGGGEGTYGGNGGNGIIIIKYKVGEIVNYEPINEKIAPIVITDGIQNVNMISTHINELYHSFIFKKTIQNSTAGGEDIIIPKYVITYDKDTLCDILMIGGGGSGASSKYIEGEDDNYNGGGGGAGTLIFYKNYLFKKGSTYEFIIGEGGIPSDDINDDMNGNSSKINIINEEEITQIFEASGGEGGKRDRGGNSGFGTNILPKYNNRTESEITDVDNINVYGNEGSQEDISKNLPGYGGGVSQIGENINMGLSNIKYNQDGYKYNFKEYFGLDLGSEKESHLGCGGIGGGPYFYKRNKGILKSIGSRTCPNGGSGVQWDFTNASNKILISLPGEKNTGSGGGGGIINGDDVSNDNNGKGGGSGIIILRFKLRDNDDVLDENKIRNMGKTHINSSYVENVPATGFEYSHDEFLNSHDRYVSNYAKRLDNMYDETNMYDAVETQRNRMAEILSNNTYTLDNLFSENTYYENIEKDVKTLSDPISDAYLPYSLNTYKDDIKTPEDNNNQYLIITLYRELLGRQPTKLELYRIMSKLHNKELDQYTLRTNIINSEEYIRLIKLQSNNVNPELEYSFAKNDLINTIAKIYNNELEKIIPTGMSLPLRDIYIYMQYNKYLFRAMLNHNNYIKFENEILNTDRLKREKLLDIFNTHFILYELTMKANDIKRYDLYNKNIVDNEPKESAPYNNNMSYDIYNNNDDYIDTANLLSKIVEKSDKIYDKNGSNKNSKNNMKPNILAIGGGGGGGNVYWYDGGNFNSMKEKQSINKKNNKANDENNISDENKIGTSVTEPITEGIYGYWSKHYNIDIENEGNISVSHYNDEDLENLKKIVEENNYSAISISEGHAKIKNFDYQIGVDDCSKTIGYNNIFYIWHPDNIELEGGE